MVGPGRFMDFMSAYHGKHNMRAAKHQYTHLCYVEIKNKKSRCER